MAEMSEDTLVSGLRQLPAQISEEDIDQEDDDAPDYRFLSSLGKGKNQGKVLKRGEKDFEPHGTRHQEGLLEGSRDAMREVLSHTRKHIGKAWVKGLWFGDEDSLGCDEDLDQLKERMREGRDAMSDDYVVCVESPKGSIFRCLGQSTTGLKNARLWLLPEEALYLVERGNLDLWWPGKDALKRSSVRDEETAEVEGQEKGDDQRLRNDPAGEEPDEGLPMSLQAAYALLIGQDGDRGTISLEKYAVYANLKRAGYVVLRATTSIPSITALTTKSTPVQSESIFFRLFGSFFKQQELRPSPYGPLVKPGLYRSYIPIYQQLSIIPRHEPSAVPSSPAPSPSEPFRVHYHLWKPTRIPTFSKSNPGQPDFRLCVVDARSTSVPTLMQITSLLESTPWDPVPQVLEGKLYQKLRHGWRNVVMAVNDQGVISYLRMGEGAWGEEKLFEKFGNQRARGGKYAGGRARGRGRARGGRSR